MEDEVQSVAQSAVAGSLQRSSQGDVRSTNRLSAGFLAERRLSQEEIAEREKWISLKRSQSNILMKGSNRYTRKILNFPEIFHGLYCAQFSHNGETLLTTFGSGCIQLRNGETGELRNTIKSGLDSSLPVTCSRFHPMRKEIAYASSACGSIFICNTIKIEFWKFIQEMDNEIYAIDLDIFGQNLISVGKTAALNIYDAENAKLIHSYKKDESDLIPENAVKYHNMRIFDAKFHDTNYRMIVTGGWDDTIRCIIQKRRGALTRMVLTSFLQRQHSKQKIVLQSIKANSTFIWFYYPQIWDTRIGDGSVRTIYGPHICGHSIDLRGSEILTGSWVVRNSLQIWDSTSGKLIETINPLNRPVNQAGEFLYCAQYFDGDPYGDHVLVGGSATEAVEIISVKKKIVVDSFESKKPTMAIDSYKSHIVFGGTDTKLNLVDYH